MKAILSISLCVVLGALGVSARAQTREEIPASSLVSKSTVAIGFTVGGGSTKVDLIGTELMPQANGEAKVEGQGQSGSNQRGGNGQRINAAFETWCGVSDFRALDSYAGRTHRQCWRNHHQ